MSYKNKNIVIIGLGITGFSCINFFLSRSIIPRVMDTRIFPPSLDKLPNFIECCFGYLNPKWLHAADLIVLSPGIGIKHPLIQEVARTGVEIVSDIELFCREAKAPIVAITGTNGKSTVSALIYEIAKQSGVFTGLGGNFGVPALNLLLHPYQLYVLELSSFQLETTYSLHSVVATILNITEDHIDRYADGLHAYQKAKLRIYNNAKICLYNIEDSLTYPKLKNNQSSITFGIDKGDYHLNIQNGSVLLQVNNQNVLKSSEIKLIGNHNYLNALAALAISDLLGFPRLSSLTAITNFVGLPHRFQLVLKKHDVQWINDSKATNVVSTIVALNSIKEIFVEGIIHLLLGGDGKNSNFNPLIPYLQGDRIKVYCFGRDRDRLAKLRPQIAKKSKTMIEAIKYIASIVKPGDLVLLSPACSSLDQFSNFCHRGNIFTKLAKKLGC
ncbi:MAG: UDP-N-acetylmuramoyl-L-alanine--D-glutamate ligase [Candidatus Dasytiphilus stammeri]